MALSSIQLNSNDTVGSAIGTDSVSSVHYQYMKLMDGTAGQTTAIPGGATGLAVNLKSVGTDDGNIDSDVVDRAARDCGKIDIAAFDVGLPAGTNWLGYVALATTGTVGLPTGAATSARQDTQTTALQLIDDAISQGGAATNTKYMVAGAEFEASGEIGALLLDGNGYQKVTVGTAIPAVTLASGGVTAPIFVTPTPSTSGGWSPRFVANLAAASIGIVKDAAGTLGGWYVYNPNGTVGFVQFFNTNVVVPGTTVPIMSIGIPSTGAANLEFTNGIQFTSVIRVAATTLSSNATGVTTGLECNFLFK